jgi:hypothetical protein
MERRQYYSARKGATSGTGSLDLPTLKRLFVAFYQDILNRELLQELLGKDCVDYGDHSPVGKAGADVAIYVLRKVRKDNLWPIHEHIDGYSEDDLFDIIEFLYDHVSEGISGFRHEWNGCGMHYDTFDRAAGQRIYRVEINDLLSDYGDGFELSAAGEIAHLPESGFGNLVVTGLPSDDPINIDLRVQAAVSKYLRRSSTVDDRRDAVRGLVDVLEYLRPRLAKVLTKKDEADLFNIANNFAIRHHNDRQQANYDLNIWTSWMFYFYLATIHAAQRLIQRSETQLTERAG